MKKITETTHLKLSKEKLPVIPACESGILKSLRFSRTFKTWRHGGFNDFEYNGLVTTQPKTKRQTPELWLVKKSGSFRDIFMSFQKRLLSGNTLTWRSQHQIEKFCEQNPEILKKYNQGVYFLISRCESDDLYVIKVEQNPNVKKFDPRFGIYSIDYGGGVNERNHGEKKELHCFIIPNNWRKVFKK